MKKPSQSRVLITAAVLAAGLGSTVLFQNCSRANFSQSSDSLASVGGAGASGRVTTFANTTMNTPVAFGVKHAGTFSGITLSVAPAGTGGVFAILDNNTMQLQYTPDYGFRGRQTAVVTATDKYGTALTYDVIVDVGNSLGALEPALAVRATGCINCHTTVGSNIITDFGYGGDGHGRDYFLTGADTSGGTKWNSGSIYGDHGNNFNTFAFDQARALYLPKIAMPPSVLAVMPAGVPQASMGDYVRWQFGASQYPGTKATVVNEAQTVYIGAPTADQIKAGLKLGGQRQTFFPNDTNSPALAGLQDKGTYFKASGTITCDGDVGLIGPLFLDHVTVNTQNGCRFYVVGSVFVSGTIAYGAGANPNVQITSSRAVALGVGTIYKNGLICEAAGGWYAAGNDNGAMSTLVERFKRIWTIKTHVTRESGDALALGAAVIADNDAIVAGEGTPIWDATCTPEGRAVSYQHLLVNAPYVHSRYQGQFDGTVIAEVALMALDSFKFTFDPVFNQVPVLPFVAKDTYLDVH